jgi:hypothetical protein
VNLLVKALYDLRHVGMFQAAPRDDCGYPPTGEKWLGAVRPGTVESRTTSVGVSATEDTGSP